MRPGGTGPSPNDLSIAKESQSPGACPEKGVPDPDGLFSADQPVTIHRRLISWSQDGTPIATSAPTLARSQIEELASVALSLPYEGADDRYRGMTNVEVALIRAAGQAAAGDTDVLKDLLDRVLGKPKQSSEIKKLTVTYEDVLREMAAEDSKKRQQTGARSRAEAAHAVVAAEIVDDDDEEFPGLGELA